MENEYILVEKCSSLKGSVDLLGAKNAVLVIMASLILTSGKSKLTNVPFSDDVKQMILLLQDLGATILANENSNSLVIDTASINKFEVSPEIMIKMRASILVMGPLLARFSQANVALPGGDLIGVRPINYHIDAFRQMGAIIQETGQFLKASVKKLKASRFVLEYPSVGATENILMASVLTSGISEIINAAIEPEVLDLILVLQKMGAKITIEPPATIIVEGVQNLNSIDHHIMYDRLEAGSLILAAAITGGEITLPQAPAYCMDVFLEKLKQMGHEITIGDNKTGITFKATKNPKCVSFRTMPYPGFPTDLQAPMMAVQCLASGSSTIEETVFENRFLHVSELKKMGAQISIVGKTATIKGVDQLYGANVISTDIRASCALVLAGLSAIGSTKITGVHHLKRGYENLTNKLSRLGAVIALEKFS